MKYSITFFVLGIGSTSYALIQGGYWNFLHWFSFSFLSLAVGYAGWGYEVFGKKKRGKISLRIKILHLPFLFTSWLIWRTGCLFSQENAIDKVTEELFVGRRLLDGELPDAIVHCVDLTCEMDENQQVLAKTRYVNLPILDADTPNHMLLNSVIDILNGRPIFVHCAQGHGRTGLFALAFLARRKTIHSFEEGMVLLKTARPGIALNKKQEKFIREYISSQFSHSTH